MSSHHFVSCFDAVMYVSWNVLINETIQLSKGPETRQGSCIV